MDPCNMYFGGPNFLIVQDELMLAGGRMVWRSPYGRFPKTILALMSMGHLEPLLILPSGGDTNVRHGLSWG